ncbi:MAG: hypothetical protein ACP5D7_06460 [Limnospira sp.]
MPPHLIRNVVLSIVSFEKVPDQTPILRSRANAIAPEGELGRCEATADPQDGIFSVNSNIGIQTEERAWHPSASCTDN